MTLLVAVAWIDAFTHWVDVIDGIVWGVPLIALILFGLFRPMPKDHEMVAKPTMAEAGEAA